MKSTSIVRRIDDLGRVFIPKEIRKLMGVKEGDPLEVYMADGGEVCFKPFHKKSLTDDEILDRFEEMSREEKTDLIKRMIEYF